LSRFCSFFPIFAFEKTFFLIEFLYFLSFTEKKYQKDFLVEISQKQNLPVGDSIIINNETLRKTFILEKY